jgi:hypothetical protein
MQNLGCCKLHQHAHLAHLGATCMDGTGLRQVVKYPRPEADDEWGVAIYMGFRQGECRVQGETLIPRCTCESEFGNRCACIFATSVAPMPKLEESPQRTAPRRGAARVGMGVGEKTKPEARAGRKESVIVGGLSVPDPARRAPASARQVDEKTERRTSCASAHGWRLGPHGWRRSKTAGVLYDGWGAPRA